MDAILSLWIATLGLTRINLLGGNADVLLSPFLILSPVVIGLGMLSVLRRHGRFTIPSGLARFALLASMLLATVLTSAFLSHDLPVSARRTLLLCIQVGAVMLCGLILANRPDPRRILIAGAVAGLVISVVFNLLQIGYWFFGEWLPGPIGAVVSTEPGNYSGLVPRLTGGSHDPNLGGFLVLGQCFFVALFLRPGRWRSALLLLAGVSILLTLSRSVMLAAVVLLVVLHFQRRGGMISQQAVIRSATAVAAVCLLLLLVPATMGGVEAAWEVVGGRFTLGEGSSREHASVMARGWETGTRDLKRMLFGVGYGNAFTVLQDIFPGNRYGNFHSLFVTLFAESGVIAAALGLALFAVPLGRGGPYLPLLAALLVFNLFQQTQTEPASWLWLLLGWTGVGVVAGSGERRSPGLITGDPFAPAGARGSPLVRVAAGGYAPETASRAAFRSPEADDESPPELTVP